MTVDRERLGRLRDMADMVLDARTQTMRQANEARAALQRQLDALEVKPAPEGLSWPAPEQARFGYEQWAAVRRAEINLRLSAQTVICLQAAEETRLAFGRQMALKSVAVPKRRDQLS